MKYTSYFAATRQRPDRQRIQQEWIEETLEAPEFAQVQDDGRIRKWRWIPEEERYLRIILLADGETVHNAFFDRSFKRRQHRCE